MPYKYHLPKGVVLGLQPQAQPHHQHSSKTIVPSCSSPQDQQRFEQIKPLDDINITRSQRALENQNSFDSSIEGASFQSDSDDLYQLNAQDVFESRTSISTALRFPPVTSGQQRDQPPTVSFDNSSPSKQELQAFQKNNQVEHKQGGFAFCEDFSATNNTDTNSLASGALPSQHSTNNESKDKGFPGSLESQKFEKEGMNCLALASNVATTNNAANNNGLLNLLSFLQTSSVQQQKVMASSQHKEIVQQGQQGLEFKTVAGRRSSQSSVSSLGVTDTFRSALSVRDQNKPRQDRNVPIRPAPAATSNTSSRCNSAKSNEAFSRSSTPESKGTKVTVKKAKQSRSKSQTGSAASSNLRGITQRPSGKWQAQLFYQGKSRYIGVFETRERAALAYEMAREQLKNDACRDKVTTCVQALKKNQSASSSPPPVTRTQSNDYVVQNQVNPGPNVAVSAPTGVPVPWHGVQQQIFKASAPSPAPSQQSFDSSLASNQGALNMLAPQGSSPMELSHTSNVSNAPHGNTSSTPLCGTHASPPDVTASAQKAAFSMLQIMQQQQLNLHQQQPQVHQQHHYDQVEQHQQPQVHHQNQFHQVEQQQHAQPQQHQCRGAITTTQLQHQPIHAASATSGQAGFSQTAFTSPPEMDATNALLQNLKQFTSAIEKTAASSQMVSTGMQPCGHNVAGAHPNANQQNQHQQPSVQSSLSASPVSFLQTASDFSSLFQNAQAQIQGQHQANCDSQFQFGSISAHSHEGVAKPISRVISHCSSNATADFQQSHNYQSSNDQQSQFQPLQNETSDHQARAVHGYELPSAVSAQSTGMPPYGSPALVSSTTTYIQAPAATIPLQSHVVAGAAKQPFVTPYSSDANQHAYQHQHCVETPTVATPAPHPSPLAHANGHVQGQSNDAYSTSYNAPPASSLAASSNEQEMLEQYKENALAILASGILPRGITQRPSGKWQAQLYYSGKSRYIGVFDDRNKAVLAYEIAREKLKSDPSKSTTKDQTEAKVFFEDARRSAFHGVKSVNLGLGAISN